MEVVSNSIQQIEQGWSARKIRLIGTRLGQPEFAYIKEVLKEQSCIRSLEICLSDLHERDIVDFAREMQHFNLTGLQLVHVGATENAAMALATAVQECEIKKLDLTYNVIGPEGAKALFHALYDCGLESLLLARNRITEEPMKDLAKVLGSGGTSLRTIDLSRNMLTDEGMLTLLRVFHKSALDILILDGNSFTVASIRELRLQNTVRYQLVNLSLGENELGDDSAKEVADMLNDTRCIIEMISLNNNRITDAGVEHLAKALREENKSLEYLDLKNNTGITNASAEILIDAVRTHRKIKKIILTGTQVDVERMTAMDEKLARLHNERATIMTTLCAVNTFPRMGIKSPFSALPRELFRSIADMIG